MPSLRIANIATAAPMGAQVYEEQVASRASAVLPDAWDVRRMTFRSLRSPLPGTHRLPLGRLASSGTTTRRLVGRALHPRGAVLHRMNLEIPPADGEVVTLHDVVSWRFDDESAPVAAAAEELRRAAAVVCVSAFTASEAGNLLGVVDPVVVPNGVDEAFFDAEPLGRDVLAGLGVEGDYVLTGGGASTRKNLAALAAAWPRIRRERPGLTLVLSGPEHARRTELFAGLDGVRLVGRVDATWVPGLVAAAAAVVVPSTYEGFGLPALEAMAAGTPVVAADTSSLPEVVGDGGLLVPPTPDGVVDGVLATLADDTEVRDRVLRGAARSRDYTWQRSAEGHAAVWTRVASGRS